jgi:hypothetical protein
MGRPMSRLRLACSVLLLAASVSPAPGADSHVQELEDIFTRSRQHYSQSQTQQALDLLDQAAQLMWSRLPLSIRQAHLLQSAPGGSGRYQPRQNAILKPREGLVIYLQPQGFAVRRQDGMFLYHLVSGYKLKDAWGRVLREEKDFSSFTGSEFSFPSRLSIVITYNFSGLSYGGYQLETSLRDLYGNQKTAWRTLFSIEP